MYLSQREFLKVTFLEFSTYNLMCDKKALFLIMLYTKQMSLLIEK